MKTQTFTAICLLSLYASTSFASGNTQPKCDQECNSLPTVVTVESSIDFDDLKDQLKQEAQRFLSQPILPNVSSVIKTLVKFTAPLEAQL